MHKTFLIFVERINNAIGNRVRVRVLRVILMCYEVESFLQQLQKFKICEQLVGRKQIWCGKGQNFNSLAIGRIGTDGLQWSTSKNMTTKNQYFSKKDDVLSGFDIYFAVLSLVMSNYP